jgi:hypothetical protein
MQDFDVALQLKGRAPQSFLEPITGLGLPNSAE